MWLMLSLISAFFLGVYDVSKKRAVVGNAVFPVLFISTLSAALCTLPVILLSYINPSIAQQWHIFIPPQSPAMHFQIVAKSLIVGISWVLSYFGLKHLPITIASPIRATAPLFTVLGAVVLFGERPSFIQWSGITLILTSYLLYSKSTPKEESVKPSTKWIIFMIFSAVTGALSAGFDKYLLQKMQLPPLFVLCWFLFYLSIIFGIIALLFWYPQRKKSTPFTFRWGIVFVGVLLVVADIFYMTALSNPVAKLSLVSAIRRSNVLISFVAGVLLFREGNIRQKIIPFMGIIIGLILIMLKT